MVSIMKNVLNTVNAISEFYNSPCPQENSNFAMMC